MSSISLPFSRGKEMEDDLCSGAPRVENEFVHSAFNVLSFIMARPCSKEVLVIEVSLKVGHVTFRIPVNSLTLVFATVRTVFMFCDHGIG